MGGIMAERRCDMHKIVFHLLKKRIKCPSERINCMQTCKRFHHHCPPGGGMGRESRDDGGEPGL